MANEIMLLLMLIGVGALVMTAYYLHKNMEEHDEILIRLQDLESATNGYCKGELNGAFSRMLNRAKEKKNER